MVVVVVLLAVVDTDVPELGSLSIAVPWSLNLVQLWHARGLPGNPKFQVARGA